MKYKIWPGAFTGRQQSIFTGNPENDREINQETLSSLGVDTKQIDEKIENDIQEFDSKKISQDDFLNRVKEIMKRDSTLKDEEALKIGLELAKQKGYTIEGIDIDKELEQFGVYEPEEKPVMEELVVEKNKPVAEKDKPTSAVGALVNKVTPEGGFFEKAKELNDKLAYGSSDVITGGVAKAPEILGNIVGFFADVGGEGVETAAEFITGKDYKDTKSRIVGDFIRELGTKGKKELQELMYVDPESSSTKAGELLTEVGTMFIPGGQEQVLSKFPKVQQVTQFLAEKAPKTFKTLKSALSGAKEAGKFQVASEGEVTPTGLTIGATANPVIDKTGKVITSLIGKDVVGGLTKVIKPSTKLNNKVIKEDMSIIGQSLKSNNKRPETIEQLYNDLVDIQKKLYKDKINPLLEKGRGGGSKINISELVDDIIPKVSEVKQVKGKQLSGVFGRGKEAKDFEKVVKQIKEIGDLDFLEAETLKQYTSALLGANKTSKTPMLNSLQEDFIMKLNKQLGDVMDKKIKGLTGEGIKQYKREFAAIANHLDSLNRRIINESKLTGDTLFSGLGKIGGINEIIKGNVTGGMSQILTGEILKLLKDPNDILKRTMKQLYKENVKKTPTKIGIGAGAAGSYLDKPEVVEKLSK